LALAFLISVLLALQSAAAQNTPVSLTIDKTNPDGDMVWNGTTAGVINGDLAVTLTPVDTSMSVWLIELGFEISSGDDSQSVRLLGTLDSSTGAIRANGVVTQGSYQGAQARLQAQQIDPDTQRIQGVLEFLPGS